MRVTLSAIAVIMLLAACGQKGPLYLPDANGTVVTRPTQSQPTNTQPTSPQPQTRTPEQSPQPADTEKERKSPPK
jgi:predicted small lipoprotein YifL